MEQSHHLLDLIHSYFPHESADIRTISPLKLAYLGDAVYEIIIRTLIMERTGGPVKICTKERASLSMPAHKRS